MMKPILCFVLFLSGAILPPAFISAQVTFGLQTGANFGTIQYSQDAGIKEKYRGGYIIGASTQWKILERLSLGTDVQFSMKAAGLGLKGQPDKNDVRFQNFNLEVVPHVTYFFTRNVGVSLGVYAAYLVKQRTKIPNRDWGDTQRNFYGKGGDAGLAPGIVLQFGRLSGFVRYTHGLLAIDQSITYTDDEGREVGVVKLFNRYFQAGLGYVLFE